MTLCRFLTLLLSRRRFSSQGKLAEVMRIICNRDVLIPPVLIIGKTFPSALYAWDAINKVQIVKAAVKTTNVLRFPIPIG